MRREKNIEMVKVTENNVLKKIMQEIVNLLAIIVLVIFILTAILGITGYVYYVSTYKGYVDSIVNNMTYDDFNLDINKKYYYDDGSLMLLYSPYQLEKIESVADLTDEIKYTTIAAEDERFYDHNGVDLKSITRALVADLKARDNVQGASTITQQLVKLTYLSSEKSIDRKIKEALISIEVEKKFTKNEILVAYLNRVCFGNGIYGIADASEYYFSKSFKDLTYDEAASLIAIVNSPSNLEPIEHYENNQGRKNRILKIIGGDDVELHDTAFTININYGSSYQYSDYANSCISYIMYLMENDEELTDKSEIKTTINKSLQSDIEDMVNDLREPLQASATVIDNRTGKVIAIVGGKTTDTVFGLNRAFQSPRQTGSSIKPLLDYGVVLDSYDIDPDFEVADVGGKGIPKNSDGYHRGRLPIRKAVTKSVNTVAFRLYSFMVDDGLEPLSYLEKMNFSHLAEQDYRAKAVSIGGFTYGATTLEMASGYATLANKGVYRTPTALEDIEPEETTVYSPLGAYYTTDALSDVAYHGTARKLNPKFPLSCKTGTTNNGKDAWLCGYTKDYSIAVWVGADNYNEKYSVKSSGEVLEIFKGILNDLNPVDEPIYSDLDVALITNRSYTRRDPSDLEEYFNKLCPKKKAEPTPDPNIYPNTGLPIVPVTPVPPVTPPVEQPVPQQEVVPQQ